MKKFLAGLIFFVVGAIILFFGYSWYKKAKDTESWPETEGIVLYSEVNSHVSDGSTMYKPIVKYTYSVNGKEFTSSKYSYGEYSSSDSDFAYEIVDLYPKGKKVSVYYNPSKPYKAVLETGVGFMIYIPLVLGVIFSAIGLLVLIKPLFKLIFVIFSG